jgi:DNA gyrase/topoisomerase IV subunit A
LEKLYHHELRQRKTIEEALSIQRREMEETRIKCETLYEELHDAGEEHVILEQCITELKSALEDEKQKLAASKHLVEELRGDKEKLQQERGATAEELRQTKKEQRVSVPAAEAVINTEFAASELQQATRNFDQALKIGEGGFGCVYRGSLRSTTVAIKLMHPKSLQGQPEFNQEVSNFSDGIISSVHRVESDSDPVQFVTIVRRLLSSAGYGTPTSSRSSGPAARCLAWSTSSSRTAASMTALPAPTTRRR